MLNGFLAALWRGVKGFALWWPPWLWGEFGVKGFGVREERVGRKKGWNDSKRDRHSIP